MFRQSGCLVIERCSSAREVFTSEEADRQGLRWMCRQGGCSLYGYIIYFMALPLTPSPGTCDTAWTVWQAVAIPLSKFRLFGLGRVSRVEWRAPRPVEREPQEPPSRSKPLLLAPHRQRHATATLPDSPPRTPQPLLRQR